MKYSIVIPYLSNSKCIDLCKKYLQKNSMYAHEIVEIIDETDVYYAYNKGVYQSKCDTVVLLNDDMIVSKNWDEHIPFYSSQDTILTGYVVEAKPGKMLDGPNAIEYNCGTIEDFDYERFQTFVDKKQTHDVIHNSKGWYMPLVVNKRSFVTYPNINKHPEYANDVVLVEQILPSLGYKFDQIKMYVYHFARQSVTHNIVNRKRCIFSYSNHQIEDKIITLQNKVIDKYNKIFNCKYEYLRYREPDGKMFPDQVIDYGLQKLFYEDNYDTVLILDIDCIPLSAYALEYTFEQAEQGKLVGNIQRSNHIENNKHTYVAPSGICLTKEMYEKLGKPSFKITKRGDIGEELTYLAEEKELKIEKFLPSSYEALPFNGSKPWQLGDGQPEYGIGTTFVNDNGEEMFYHLFESRVHKFNDLFFLKCANLLLKN